MLSWGSENYLMLMGMDNRSEGLWRPARADDVPIRCDEIGCGCVISKRLEVFRNGPKARVFVCPSSRVAATYEESVAPILLMGRGYHGELR
ncbi:MAG: hypothetical protein NVSMB19_15910 [Vulcanimicrobiaceae bacterium]